MSDRIEQLERALIDARQDSTTWVIANCIITQERDIARAERDQWRTSALTGLEEITKLRAENKRLRSRVTILEVWIEAEAEARGEADANYPAERRCAQILSGSAAGGGST